MATPLDALCTNQIIVEKLARDPNPTQAEDHGDNHGVVAAPTFEEDCLLYQGVNEALVCEVEAN